MKTSERYPTSCFQYDFDGKIPVTQTSLEETPGLAMAIVMCPDDFKPRVTIEVSEASEKDARIGSIALAHLRTALGEEIALSKKDQRILDDPRSLDGANITYIADRVNYGYGVIGAIKKAFSRFA